MRKAPGHSIRPPWPPRPAQQAPRREAKLRRLFDTEELHHDMQSVPSAAAEAAAVEGAEAAAVPRSGDGLDPLALLRALGRGLLHLSFYRCEEAVAAFRSLPRSQYATGWVLSCEGRALAEGVRYRESAAAFERARAADPTLLRGLETYSTVLWQLKRGPELSALAQQALRLDRLSPVAWCVAGNCFSLQREHATALRFFRRATQLDGTASAAHALAGHELRAVEAHDAALAAYRAAARADPRHYVAWYGMGAVYARLERWAMAEHHFRRAAALRPASSALLCHLGGALRRLGRAAEALRTLRRAVELDPKNPLARFEAAALLAAAGRPREALRELRALHDAAPQDPSTLYQMGRMHRRLGEPDAALRCFSAALDLQPPAADGDLIKAAIERLRVAGDDEAPDDEASDEDM